MIAWLGLLLDGSTTTLDLTGSVIKRRGKRTMQPHISSFEYDKLSSLRVVWDTVITGLLLSSDDVLDSSTHGASQVTVAYAVDLVMNSVLSL